MAKASSKVRPLHIRPGARYRCFGDGLCCTDIHVLGPLGRKDLVRIRRADPAGSRLDEELEEQVIATAPDGGCHFLLPDQRCDIHARVGPEAKPDFCQRFPVGLVATPAGGRVTTHHRCPCRTLGQRPSITLETAEATLSDKRGRLVADRRVQKVRLERKAKKIPFATWRVLEAELLAALEEGEPIEAVLGVEPFPRLKGRSWEDVAEEFVRAIDGTGFGFATAWFAESVRALRDDGHRMRVPPRPWSVAFERAAARPGSRRGAEEVYADWIADEIWSLAWADDERSFDVVCAELATRIAVARRIAKTLEVDHALGGDRAAAEAIMVVELVGDSEFWSEVIDRIRL